MIRRLDAVDNFSEIQKYTEEGHGCQLHARIVMSYRFAICMLNDSGL